MDYEKKYNEAMLRADEAVQKGCLDKDMFDIIFPPEESEDERIRKWLVEYFGSIKETVWIHRDITCEQILAWLEKQKEQKELPLMDGYADLYFDEWNQQKQNPTKRQCFEEGMRYARRLQKEQNPTEWSEEDKLIYNSILQDYASELEEHHYSSTRPKLNWLKSLRTQPQGVYKQIVHNILDMIDRYESLGYDVTSSKTCIPQIRAMCKTADECHEILDEPSWKPSEIHKTALLMVIRDPNNAGSESCQLALRDLLEQLKKL